MEKSAGGERVGGLLLAEADRLVGGKNPYGLSRKPPATMAAPDARPAPPRPHSPMQAPPGARRPVRRIGVRFHPTREECAVTPEKTTEREQIPSEPGDHTDSKKEVRSLDVWS